MKNDPDDENENLLNESPGEPGDYVETRTICGIPYKSAIRYTGIYLIIYFWLDVLYFIAIGNNIYFRAYYWYLYGLFLKPSLLGFVFYLMYFCCVGNREWVPWALLAVSISINLNIVWLILYCTCFYHAPDGSNDIETNLLDRLLIFDWSSHDGDNYVKMDKTLYLILHLWRPIISLFLFVSMFVIARDWHERHGK